MAAPRLDFWLEFASPYSWLSAARIEAEAVARGVEVAWRPFLLGPIFRTQGWDTSPFNVYPAKGRYMWRDMARRAAALGLPPLTRPEPFPQNSLLAARIALMAPEGGWRAEFCKAAFAAQFAQGRRIDDPDVLAALLFGFTPNAAAMIARAQSDQAVKAALREATSRAQAAGVFGAPSFVTADGELFWGDDRLEDALAWGAAHG